MTQTEARTLVPYALGRLFKIGSRPFKEGDHEQFDKIKSILMIAKGDSQ